MRFQISLSPVFRPLFTLLGAPKGSCFADIDLPAKTLRVKSGIWFDETFPLSEVLDVGPSTWPWWGGLGVKLGPKDSVGVVYSGDGVVAVRFRRPQNMHVIIVATRPELRVSLEDPQGFMAALSEALRD